MLRIVKLSNNPRYACCLDGLVVDGKRRRQFFRSEKEARRAMRELDIQIRREGEAGVGISDADRILTRAAAALLEPYGKSVLDAARFYADHLATLATDIGVAPLAAEYETAKRNAKASGVYLVAIKHRLGRFVDVFGYRTVRTIKTAEIEEWLHGLGLGPVSVNNFRVCVGGFFSYAVRRGYLELNPVKAIDKVRVDDEPPQIFSPADMATILNAAPASLLPTLVLGGFAGLRTSELMRLEWHEVDQARGYIHVAAKKTKSARRRLVKILPNLAAWLSLFANMTGLIYAEPKRTYYNALDRLVASTGIKWPKNGLRHSYASYHLAKFEDAGGLALQLGHTSTKLIFENYRELVRPEEAEAYWSIVPAGVPANVVRIGAAQ